MKKTVLLLFLTFTFVQAVESQNINEATSREETATHAARLSALLSLPKDSLYAMLSPDERARAEETVATLRNIRTADDYLQHLSAMVPDGKYQVLLDFLQSLEKAPDGTDLYAYTQMVMRMADSLEQPQQSDGLSFRSMIWNCYLFHLAHQGKTMPAGGITKK